MNKTKLTQDEAKAEIEGLAVSCDLQARGPGDKFYAKGLAVASAILARVEMPSEEDMAVLWLIREWQWTIGRNTRGWLKVEWNEGDYVVRLISPTEEAKKLGWGG